MLFSSCRNSLELADKSLQAYDLRIFFSLALDLCAMIPFHTISKSEINEQDLID